MTVLEKILIKDEYTKNDIVALLSLTDSADIEKLFKAAYQVKLKHVGNTVWLRGLIELSNICTKDCFYCGIRKSNGNIDRFTIDFDEVVSEAVWIKEHRYGSLVMQSGERSDEKFVDTVEALLKKIHEKTGNSLGVTLSLGEQTLETYERWRKAGAHRYLLRIESSNRKIYRKIHPDDKLHDYDTRLECLRRLRKAGYQVGTGVMQGIPSQTMEDLANDVLFFKEIDIDMVGMGPYIPHNATPLGIEVGDYSEMQKEDAVTLGLKMIAVTRLVLKDVNIASTTALQALSPLGREHGLLAGANVLMPNVTDTKFRSGYQLYNDKPALNENADESRLGLERSVENIGEKIGYDLQGNSAHWKKRVEF